MFLLLKKWSRTHCHWKLDSNTHPFYCFSLCLPFFPCFSLFLSPSLATPRDMLLMFLSEPHCTSRAAKLTLCCHESDASPDRWCHLHTSDRPICPQALPDKTSAARCQACVCWQLWHRSDFWWGCPGKQNHPFSSLLCWRWCNLSLSVLLGNWKVGHREDPSGKGLDWSHWLTLDNLSQRLR